MVESKLVGDIYDQRSFFWKGERYAALFLLL